MAKSNCHFWAWKRFIEQGGWVCFRKTFWARYEAKDSDVAWWYRPIWATGVALQWIGSAIAFAGWLLRWRSWYHVVWAPDIEHYTEFVPKRPASERGKPPIIFDGEVRQK